jgi:hypothetical protein
MSVSKDLHSSLSTSVINFTELLISLYTELKINTWWEGRDSSVPYIGLPYTSQVTAKLSSFPSWAFLFLLPRNNRFVLDVDRFLKLGSLLYPENVEVFLKH